jgi:hypothetical protein
MAVQQAPGWAFRAASPDATGTTSLVITKPTGTLDGDILTMHLSHKGLDWAVLPAGWTLVARDLMGDTRVEVHWKRAAAEGADYTITGLASSASGFILAHPGGLASGDVVEGAAAAPWTAGPFSLKRGPASIDTVSPHALVLVTIGTGANVTPGSVGNQDARSNPDLTLIPQRAVAGTAAGGGTSIACADAIAVVPGETGQMLYTAVATNAVCIVTVLTPQPTVDVAGTTYYLTTIPPPIRVDGSPRGHWDAHYGAARGRTPPATWTLDRRKSGAGPLASREMFTNQQANYDLLIARWMSPPIRPQTFDGTVDLVWLIGQSWNDEPLGALDLSVVRTKLHVYITEGRTEKVRATLLNAYIDPTDWPFNVVEVTALAAAAALTPGAAHYGDCLMVEIGVRVVSSPSPDPLYPPAEWTQMPIVGVGATNQAASTANYAGVPYLDAVVGVAGSTQVPYVQFSHVVEELDEAEILALDAQPTHLTPATAKPILTLPYQEPGQVTDRIASLGRRLWYTWTAEVDEPVCAVAFGSQWNRRIHVFTGPDAATLSLLTSASGLLQFEDSGATAGTHGALQSVWFQATAGETYWIQIRSAALSGAQASSGGGWTRFGLFRARAPKVDDVYLASRPICALDACGTLVNLTAAYSSEGPTFAAIDYTRRPIEDQAHGGDPHTGERLLVGMHNFRLVEILDLPTLSKGEFQIDFLGDVWDSAGADPPSEHVASGVVDAAGRLLVGHFGDGYLHVSGPPPLPSFLSQPSEDPASSAIRRVDATHGDQQTGAPWPIAEAWEPVSTPVSPHHLAVDPDGDTVYYTSGGWYVPKSQVGTAGTKDLRAAVIRRFSLATGTALPDFATLPLDTSANAGLRGLCVVPGHGLLVCNGARVDWVNASGALVRSLRAEPDAEPSFADVKLTSDGLAVVAHDEAHGVLYRWHLLSGALIRRVDTYLGDATQLALYQPNGITLCW